MENNSTSVALVAEETRKTGRSPNTQGLEQLGRLTDSHRFDFHGNLAGLTGFLHLALMLQAEIQGNQPGGCISDQTQFQQLRLQNQLIQI